MKRILHIVGPIDRDSPLDVAGVVGHVCAVVRALWRSGVSCDIAWTDADGIEPRVLAELERFGARSYLATLDQLPALAAQYPLIHIHVQGDASDPAAALWYERLPAPRVITVHGATDLDDLPAVRVFAVSARLCPQLEEAIPFPLAVDHLQWPERILDPEEPQKQPVLLRAGSAHRVDRALFWNAVLRIEQAQAIPLYVEQADDIDWSMIEDLPDEVRSQVHCVQAIDWLDLISGVQEGILLVVEREAMGVSSAQQFAMAASIPFVASSAQRIDDLDREGGVRCPATEEGIALAVEELCAKPALRSDLGERGRRALDECLAKGVSDTIEIYRRCGAGSTFSHVRSARRYPRDLYALLGLRAAAKGAETEGVVDLRLAAPLLPQHEWNLEPTFEALSTLSAIVRMARPDSIYVCGSSAPDRELLLPALFAGEALRLTCTGRLILSPQCSADQKKLLQAVGLEYAIGTKNGLAADMVLLTEAGNRNAVDLRGVNLTVGFEGNGSDGMKLGGLTLWQGRGNADRPEFEEQPFVCPGEPEARILHATADAQFVLAAEASTPLLGDRVTGQVALIGQRAWLEAEPGTQPRLIVTGAGLCALAADFDLVHLYGEEGNAWRDSELGRVVSGPFDQRVPTPFVRQVSPDELLWFAPQSEPAPVPSLQADDEMDALLGEGELVTFVLCPDRDRDHAHFWRMARKTLEAVPGMHLAIARADSLDAALRNELPKKLRKATVLLDDDVRFERAIADRALLCILFETDERWFQRAASHGIPCLLVGGGDEEAARGYQICDRDPDECAKAWQSIVLDPDRAAELGQKARLVLEQRQETCRASLRDAYLRRLGPTMPGFKASGIPRARDLLGLLGLHTENGQGDLLGWSFTKPNQEGPFTSKALASSVELCVFVHHLCAAEASRRVLVLGPESGLIAAYAAEACRVKEGIVLVDQAPWITAMRDLSLPIRAISPGSVPDAIDLLIVAGVLPESIPQRLMFAVSALSPQGILLCTHAFQSPELRRFVKAQGLRPSILPSAQGVLLARNR